MLNRKLVVVLVFVGLVFLGCSTPYQKSSGLSGLMGGYTDTRLDRNTVRVSFRGNGYTPIEKVQNYLLYRSAEITNDYGFDYFIVVDNNVDIKRSTYQGPGSFSADTEVTATGYNTASAKTTGTYRSGQKFNFRKYKAIAVIKMFDGEKPADGYVAREVLKYLGSSVKR